MIFSKKIWAIGEKVNHFHLNRIENGIYEALSKMETINVSTQTVSGRVTISGFVQNANSYGNPFSDGYYTAVRHINFGDYSDVSFAEVPSINVTLITSAPNRVFASMGNVSKTGFDIVVRRIDNINTGVHWSAVGNV